MYCAPVLREYLGLIQPQHLSSNKFGPNDSFFRCFGLKLSSSSVLGPLGKKIRAKVWVPAYFTCESHIIAIGYRADPNYGHS